MNLGWVKVLLIDLVEELHLCDVEEPHVCEAHVRNDRQRDERERDERKRSIEPFALALHASRLAGNGSVVGQLSR